MSALKAESLSCLPAESVRWLWEPYLPRGKLALLDGDPGVGKSLITIDLAARLSRASPLPTGSPSARPHVTLLLGAEDNSRDTVRPRAEAAGADLDRVSIVTAASSAPIYFPQQIPDLEELIRLHAADLVVIDPIMAFLPPEVAANLDQCVRRGLNPLASLAERTDCAILLVRHLRKKDATRAVHRGQGSMGIIAAARTGLLAARHPADPTLGVLAVTKTNVGGSPASIGYRLKSDAAGRAVVEWTGVAELSADGLGQPLAAELPMRERAVAWLCEQLANGPRKATELFVAAGEAGIPERTLKRAKQELGTKSHKVQSGDRAVWYWYDPSAAWPADAPFKKPFELPPLDPLDPLV
ncbi:MAG: AAA family ATPase [Planctomycetia bacterium]|nr:AAA family ATPase [Planctomycetia bacterium]